MTGFTKLLVALFIIVIILSLFVSCNGAVPFYMDTIFPKHSKFENFTNNTNMTDYSSRDTNSAMDTYKPFLIDKPVAECKKIYGFNGLFCAPKETGDNLDKFADTEGKIDCKDNSGLSNSKGGLCLSPEQKQLLSTRGGNITGCNDDIGQ